MTACLVLSVVPQRLKQFTHDKKISSGNKSSLADVAQMVKKMPQYQKELNNFSTHIALASDCMANYNDHLQDICRVEQVGTSVLWLCC